MQLNHLFKAIHHYFFISYLVILWLTRGFLSGIDFSDFRTVCFTMAVYLSYGFIYLFPALALTMLSRFAVGRLTGNGERRRWMVWPFVAFAALSVGLTDVVLFADKTIYALYGFHLNGFVWNLVMTSGGIESLGGSDSAMVTYTAIITGMFAFQGMLIWVLYKTVSRLPRGKARLRYRYLLIPLLLFSLGERVAYGVSHLEAYAPVLNAATAFPFYIPTTFRSLAVKMGYKAESNPGVNLKADSGILNYPLAPLRVEPPEKPLNIVWLVAESWRADMLDAEIMPETWAFASTAQRFTQHYSGGNGTRMGLFAMFYGLYGSYWFSVLDEHRSPVLMDVLQEEHYQLGLFTSAAFSYPEFDKTLFARVPVEQMHADKTGQGWEKDRQNVTDLLAFIQGRDRRLPFMTFMFFESPHARYYFPPESVIRTPYLEDFNYASMSLERDIGLIKNRYINSCRHLDSQYGRILDFLRRENLLESTIVIITGDHGEEFMEKGRWGHNSTYSEEQTRPPLILWVPGRGAGVTQRMTSHLDIPATLLPLLGVTNPSGDYCQGFDLFNGPERDYTVVSDWSSVGYIGREFKAVFPMNAAVMFQNKVTTRDDLPVADPDAFFQTHQSILVKVMKELSAYRKK